MENNNNNIIQETNDNIIDANRTITDWSDISVDSIQVEEINEDFNVDSILTNYESCQLLEQIDLIKKFFYEGDRSLYQSLIEARYIIDEAYDRAAKKWSMTENLKQRIEINKSKYYRLMEKWVDQTDRMDQNLKIVKNGEIYFLIKPSTIHSLKKNIAHIPKNKKNKIQKFKYHTRSCAIRLKQINNNKRCNKPHNIRTDLTKHILQFIGHDDLKLIQSKKWKDILKIKRIDDKSNQPQNISFWNKQSKRILYERWCLIMSIRHYILNTWRFQVQNFNHTFRHIFLSTYYQQNTKKYQDILFIIQQMEFCLNATDLSCNGTSVNSIHTITFPGQYNIDHLMGKNNCVWNSFSVQEINNLYKIKVQNNQTPYYKCNETGKIKNINLQTFRLSDWENVHDCECNSLKSIEYNEYMHCDEILDI
jgi:hypothetical protein